jgi:penicillin-binding protein-related factor A (putative recombinase)
MEKNKWYVLDVTEDMVNQVEFSLKFGLEQAKQMKEVEAIGLFMLALQNFRYLREILWLAMNAVAKYWEEADDATRL